MPYIVTLTANQLHTQTHKMEDRHRFTVALARNPPQRACKGPGRRLLLLLSGDRANEKGRSIVWLGVLSRINSVGPVDKSLTFDPVIKCKDPIPLDGHSGLLRQIHSEQAAEFETASPRNSTGECGDSLWDSLELAIRRHYPRIAPLLNWLLAHASPPTLEDNPADRSWQEQREAARTVLRLADFPRSTFDVWQRPSDLDAPYLAGVISHPSEQSIIEHDVRTSASAFEMSGDWHGKQTGRCDIHVLTDRAGRRLEVANVNATHVEARTGADMIYYHESTRSFVLVQYKRMDPRKRYVYMTERLRSQLERLNRIAQKNLPARIPSDWRLGSDPCFLKLTYWQNRWEEKGSEKLAPGMYLPVSYVNLLLQNDCTKGTGNNPNTRRLGYPHVDRYITNDQFIELVKNGLVGTIGTTSDTLLGIIDERLEQGNSVLVAAERGVETIKERHRRAHSRGSSTRPQRLDTFNHEPSPHPTLFDKYIQGYLF